jgi:1,2-dihydroxy-3-keto-5-methylthiopentene dioxygenase
MKAYYYDDDTVSDYREDHNSGIDVSVEELERLGVLYFNLKTDEEVDALAKERDYKNKDQIVLSPNSFGSPEALKEKLDNFYTEHIHEDEEIRYINEGEGFFDVRSDDDRWIRTKLAPHDLLVLPAGIYHRFTLTTKNFIKATRLFKDEPKWTPLNRPVDDNKYRVEYLNTIKT